MLSNKEVLALEAVNFELLANARDCEAFDAINANFRKVLNWESDKIGRTA